MTPREKLDQAIREYVATIDLGPGIISVNWVLGYEAIHLDPDGSFGGIAGFVAKNGMPESSITGITTTAARMALDLATKDVTTDE